jgi:DNA primase
MGKISPVSSKYIVNASIQIDGVVDRPDVIGAIFGQTEGLLGSDLELRELQRSGRIGRIEVNVDTKGGKTIGNIIIPSSLDKAETCIVGAALEIIQRIGPCNAKILIQNIEDVRVSKRQFVVERAKDLLRSLIDTVMPDSQEIADEVAHSVRVMEITEYGRDRLPAGPAIEDSDDIIVVEGRADVLNLLKHGIKNVIAMNGTSVPETIIELSKKKEITVFVDGDRGGMINIKGLIELAEIDFITRAPDGKEVEEITKKEIHKALRGRISLEQAKQELEGLLSQSQTQQRQQQQSPLRQSSTMNPNISSRPSLRPLRPLGPRPMASNPISSRKLSVSAGEKDNFKKMLEDLIGTRGAYLLDGKLNILGKVPISELDSTLKSLNNVHAMVLDGIIDKDLTQIADRSNIKVVVGMDSKVSDSETRTTVLTSASL